MSVNTLQATIFGDSVKNRVNEMEGIRTQIPTVPWWLMLITGVAAVLLGFFLIIAPAQTLVALVQFVGIYWLITGVFSIVSIVVDRSHWVWKLFSGVMGIVAGLFIIQHPLWSAAIVPTTVIVIAGAVGVIVGIMLLVWAFVERSWGVGILAVLSLILSIILFLSPFIAVAALPFVLGGLAILGGAGAIASAFYKREPVIRAPTGG
jgi:uncharacterized membrane protein HdeD (DUF308 family)